MASPTSPLAVVAAPIVQSEGTEICVALARLGRARLPVEDVGPNECLRPSEVRYGRRRVGRIEEVQKLHHGLRRRPGLARRCAVDAQARNVEARPASVTELLRAEPAR